ncbi:hypothetical protein A6R68_01660, partial [Neotoma lepida]
MAGNKRQLVPAGRLHCPLALTFTPWAQAAKSLPGKLPPTTRFSTIREKRYVGHVCYKSCDGGDAHKPGLLVCFILSILGPWYC